MDWTTDPFVAVGFASNYPPKKELSIVYALLSIRAIEKNAAFYLPPPFVERLYLQRGLFIETMSREDDTSLQNSCISIRFKEDREFKVIRDGQEIPELMQPSDELEKLAAYAKKLAAEGVQIVDDSVRSIDGANAKLQAHWSEVGGIPSFLSPEQGEENANLWFNSMIDMIDRFSHLKTETGVAANECILKAVIRSNPVTMQALQKCVEFQATTFAKDKNNESLKGWKDLSDLLRRLLSENL